MHLANAGELDRWMDVGEHWAYRARRGEPMAEVRLERIGEQRPPRVRVAFLGDDFEGRIEWVPPSRLKTPWGARDDYIAGEQAWAALREPSKAMTNIDDDLINHVFGRYLGGDVISRPHGANSRGITVVRDWPLLEARTGLSRDEVRHPAEIERAEGTYVPWPSTLLITKALARINGEQLLIEIAAEERLEQAAAAHGRLTSHSFESRERTAELYDEFYVPYFATLRVWAGDQAEQSASQAAEVAFLRQRVGSLTDLLNFAVDQLKESGLEAEAWKLHSAIYGGKRRKPDWLSVNEIRAEEETRRKAELQQRYIAPRRAERQISDHADRERTSRFVKNRWA